MASLKINIDGIKSFRDLKEYTSKEEIKLILFAETHGLIDELPIQEDLIRNLKPSYYVYEMLEDKKIMTPNDFEEFLSKTDSEEFSIISTFGEIKPTIRLANKYNVPVIGCDIKNMGRKNIEFRTKTNWTKEEKQEEEELHKKRELHQKEIIEKIMQKTNKLIFVSVGLYHLRQSSELIKHLKKYNFVIIYPTINGNKNFENILDVNSDNIFHVVSSRDKYLSN